VPDRSVEPLRVKRTANRFSYGSLTFWAEGGGVYLIDHEPGAQAERKSITLQGWEERISHQRRVVLHLSSQTGFDNEFQKASHVQRLQVLKDLLNAMLEVARQVRAQGDIMDPKVQAHYKNHVAKVARTFQVQTNILPN